ncbi:MAG: acyl-CoA carboxylase subunit beta [Frankiaceae bacterium]|nr:acyl-CoA carboxylase subunit beta [Frankiaceae bacterium]
MTDWREPLLDGLAPLPDGPTSDAVRAGVFELGDQAVVAVAWDFAVRGGSFGVDEADVFVSAARLAARDRLPLVSFLRSGGTRLHQGMQALVGIPRALLALREVAAAHVPHVAVVDQPTTGGVWVVGSAADIRLGVAGATVGFSGARAIEAMTGVALGPGANTAESALAAGLVDDVVEGEEVPAALDAMLATLAPDRPEPLGLPAPVPVPGRRGWEQVAHSREVGRLDGAALLGLLAGTGTSPVPLLGGDHTVAAGIVRIAGRRLVVAAVAARRGLRVAPPGYRLLERAARLAGRLDVPLVTLVDTPGADPLPDSEQAGTAGVIGTAMSAVLDCAAPTVAVVHGEGGSGGALAAAVCDVVGVTPDGWFAALGPEGAAATLRTTPPEAADLMGVAPGDLLAAGFADAMAPAEPDALRGWLVAQVDQLRGTGVRRDRWTRRLAGPPGG